LWSATWNQNGIIVAETARGISSEVAVTSGTITPGRPMLWPKFLPDGKHLIYVNPDRQIGGHRAYVAELSSGRETALMATDTYVVTFVPDRWAVELEPVRDTLFSAVVALCWRCRLMLGG
jgi:hypothetical protein